jgi:hypothetical protein
MIGRTDTMNRLLYGDDDPKTIDLQYSNEPCEHCYGDGQIYYITDSGEQISKEEYESGCLHDEVTIETCEHCEGKGFLEVYIEPITAEDRFDELWGDR